MRSCVHAAPSVEAKALRSRRALEVATLRTMRSSPRRAASAAKSSPSLSSSAISNGSVSHAEDQWPPAGSTGAGGREVAGRGEAPAAAGAGTRPDADALRARGGDVVDAAAQDREVLAVQR